MLDGRTGPGTELYLRQPIRPRPGQKPPRHTRPDGNRAPYGYVKVKAPATVSTMAGAFWSERELSSFLEGAGHAHQHVRMQKAIRWAQVYWGSVRSTEARLSVRPVRYMTWLRHLCDLSHVPLKRAVADTADAQLVGESSRQGDCQSDCATEV